MISNVINDLQNKSKKDINIKISNKPKDILNSDKIVLPGQGSYRQCALAIKSIAGLWDALNEFVLIKKKPIFGCRWSNTESMGATSALRQGGVPASLTTPSCCRNVSENRVRAKE